MQTLRQVVVGSDFSAQADEALALAVQLAVATGAGVVVVHVCELDPDDLEDVRVRRSAHALDRLISRYTRAGLEIAGVLRCGQPWKKLDNVAAEVGAGLIVVGRRGAGRGSQVAIGSVAEQLVRCANRPVLTVDCDFTGFDGEVDAVDPQ